MTIQNRLNEVIRSRDLKVTEFAKICDIPYRSVQSYIRGEMKIGSDAVVKICTKFNINAHWLLLGEGQMDASPTKEPQSPEEIDKVMKKLKPEQRQEILSRTIEMEKMNELETETKRMAKCLEELEGKLEGKL